MFLNGRLSSSLGGLFLNPRVAVALLAVAQLLCGDKPRAEQFAAPPRPDADAHHRAAGGEGKPEHLWYRQRADVETDAAFGDVDDEALDPGRVGRRNHKARPPHLNP